LDGHRFRRSNAAGPTAAGVATGPTTARTGVAAAGVATAAAVAATAAVAADGDVMPQKSTYFYPKALTGLVINPHEW